MTDSRSKTLDILVDIRRLFTHMRDERVNHPALSAESREHARSYYDEKLEALTVAIGAVGGLPAPSRKESKRRFSRAALKGIMVDS